MRLLSIGADAKTSKGEKVGWRTAILYLPAGGDRCAWAAACLKGCLVSAGRMPMANAARARAARLALLRTAPEAFRAQLLAEIDRFVRGCVRDGVRPCVRLNGTSDLDWSDVIRARPDVQFYDYTKSPSRAFAFAFGDLPANYSVVFSRGGVADDVIPQLLARGVNCSVVFSTKRGAELPERFMGWRVIDGDAHDLRFHDGASGVIVGLRAKGRARKDGVADGFVVAV